MNISITKAMHRTTSCFAALLFVAACDPGIAPPEQTIWEANLIAAPEYPDVTGSFAAITRSGGTEMSIQVVGLPPSASYAWRIRSGNCSNPGSVFGSEDAYPDLVVEEPGATGADIFMARRLVAGDSYNVAVLTADPEPDQVACGELAATGSPAAASL
ncbi:MAG: hypothetical protein JSW46_04215 [Gemmatimonadota bacterium]|nr:MAG: hypothetical protein JSW46_04215 [Gemmatimonadota bacterium]